MDVKSWNNGFGKYAMKTKNMLYVTIWLQKLIKYVINNNIAGAC